MKISVLITYYNQERFVRRSLESALRQTTSHDVEILIGDDGSTDGTRDIIAEYQREYGNKITLFVMPRDLTQQHESMARVSDNRMNLLAHATGDFVCFLDGDDFYFADDFLEKGAAFLSAHPEYTGCAFDYAVVNDGEDSPARVHSLKNVAGPVCLESYFPNRYVHAGAMLFRRPEMDRKRERFHQWKLFSDNMITFLMLNYGPLYHIPHVVYVYCQHGEGIWIHRSAMEREIVNALSFTVARHVLPETLAPLSFLRFRGPVERVYANKEKLMEIVGEKKIRTYTRVARRLGTPFIETLLNWHSATTRQKRLAMRCYRALSKKAVRVEAACRERLAPSGGCQ
ncbi:glycosyltransferase [Desulfovibrio sp. OttesenSCG-928-O18]|nr:glycosyltransferase [Desulfovibrio sp. OttesenSCG-928-O18]